MKFRLLRIEYFILIFLDLVEYQNYIDPNYEQNFTQPFIHSFIQYSVWRQVQSLHQNDASI